MAKPKRTFTGQEGQRSVGTAGPDAIRYDLDNLFAALDPDDTFKDGTSGGIGEENLRQVTIDQADEPTGNTGHIRQLFSWLANIVRKITGNANWYDAPKTTLTATKAHMDANTGVHGVGASTVESVAGSQSKVDTHEAKTATHGATASATANRIVLRDSSGRAQIATPTLASDIANKSYVDGKISEVDVVGDVSGHINRTDAHSATNAATANRIIMRDAYGRAKVAAPSASDDIARKDTVDAHANASAPHSGHATTSSLSSHTGNKSNPHSVTASQVGAAASSHTHTWSQVTSPPAQATRWPSWSEVTSKPSTFAPSSHTHTASQVTGVARFSIGTYTGNSENTVYDNLQTISLGFTPKAVLVWPQSASIVQFYSWNSSHKMTRFGGLAVTGGPIKAALNLQRSELVKITTNGFVVNHYRAVDENDKKAYEGPNAKGAIYNYVAFY